MNFKFKNSTQATELMSHLRLGQIIKIQVLEKSGHNLYMISFRGLVLSAVSEMDLTSKSCWLKVTQLVPFPKLQIIIEDKKGFMNDLLSYADENDLEIPNIPELLKTKLISIPVKINIQELYKFIDIYAEWSVISDLVLHLDNYIISDDGITISDLNQIFSFNVIVKNKEKVGKVSSKLLFSVDELSNSEASYENILNVLMILSKVNLQLTKSNIRLALFHIKYQNYEVILPVEYSLLRKNELIKGLFKTKNFGNIYFKNDLSEKIFLSFENSIFMNAIRAIVKKQDTPVFLSIQNPLNNHYQSYQEVSFSV